MSPARLLTPSGSRLGSFLVVVGDTKVVRPLPISFSLGLVMARLVPPIFMDIRRPPRLVGLPRLADETRPLLYALRLKAILKVGVAAVAAIGQPCQLEVPPLLPSLVA